MSTSTAFLIGLLILLGALFILQLVLRYRYEAYVDKFGPILSRAAEPKMSAKASFGFGLFHTVFYSYIIIWALYEISVETFSLLLGIGAIFVALVLIRKPIQLVRDNRPIHPKRTITLPLPLHAPGGVTPDLVMDILREKTVSDAIRQDLQRTCQIGGKEQWRLGLLTPDMDTYDLSYFQLSRPERLSRGMNAAVMANLSDQIPVKRWAILHSTGSFNVQMNNLLIVHGLQKPMISSYPAWSYPLKSHPPKNDYQDLRAIAIDTASPSAARRSPSLLKFLQEDGFPLKDSYPDGDPLTTERGGTIVFDKGQLKIIYADYFVQSRLIDDAGNLVYMGLDEHFGAISTGRGVPVIPSVSRKLVKCVAYEAYVPIVRYRSFPYASDFMLPILDTPLSDSGWADLFIDTRGKAKLFIAKQKTLAEWYEMMERLRQLFYCELTRKGYHLLGLTKDQRQLHDYFIQKQMILEDYFIMLDWALT